MLSSGSPISWLKALPQQSIHWGRRKLFYSDLQASQVAHFELIWIEHEWKGSIPRKERHLEGSWKEFSLGNESWAQNKVLIKTKPPEKGEKHPQMEIWGREGPYEPKDWERNLWFKGFHCLFNCGRLSACSTRKITWKSYHSGTFRKSPSSSWWWFTKWRRRCRSIPTLWR